MSVLQDLIPESTLSQKCHMSPNLNGYRDINNTRYFHLWAYDNP